MPTVTENVAWSWSLRDEVALKFMQAMLAGDAQREPSPGLAKDYVTSAYLYADVFLAASQAVPER